MRINIITHYYAPEIGAPQARLSEMAKVWKDKGHDVTVHTCFPNHPTGIIPEEYRGKIFQAETGKGGERILRYWSYATPNKGLVRKTLGHLSFMVSSVLLKPFYGKRPDIYLVSSPTFFSVISAWILSLLRRTPFIFEVRDLWPGIFVELGVLKNKMLIKTLEAIELFLYARAKKVVVVTEGFKTDLIKRGVDPEKIEVITNGVDLEFFKDRGDEVEWAQKKRVELGLQNKFIVLYMGAHGISQGLESVMETAHILSQSDSEVAFLFVGEGAVKEKLISMAQEKNLKNMIFLKGVPREETPYYYKLAQVCLVPLRNIDGFETFIPSKMFEIMACKRPILGQVRGEAARIFERSGGAMILGPEKADELAEAIIKLKKSPEQRQQMGERGYEFVAQHYDRIALGQNYLKVMKEILASQ